MPGERPSDRDPDAPRTDLPPGREPRADDDLTKGEREGVAREGDAGEDDGGTGRGRSAAEDAAGGDRGIL